MQRLIACALSIGISKQELFTSYYIDEIRLIFEQWNKLHQSKQTDDFMTEEVDIQTFLGDGGEMA